MRTNPRLGAEGGSAGRLSRYSRRRSFLRSRSSGLGGAGSRPAGGFRGVPRAGAAPAGRELHEPEGEVWEYPLWRQIYHRGQVTNMLRVLGAQPAATDFLVFWDEGG